MPARTIWDARKLENLSPAQPIPADELKITIDLLNAVEADSGITQRSMARELGVALGLANAYLKRCVRKGLVKVQDAPANRYAYYLTPKGFSEKSRLTAQYLSMSFNFYRRARSECAELFRACDVLRWRRVALAGVGDLGEIATLCAVDTEIEIVGFFDPAAAVTSFAGLPVVRDLVQFGPLDAVMITSLKDPQDMFNLIAGQLAPDRVVSPALLGISRNPPELAE